MKEFAENPCKFLKEPPKMPNDFRILFMGPKGVGIHTQTRMLEEFYGWRTVDFNVIV